MIDQPLHVREHSKSLLTRAITCDTNFLSSHLVMDYSLLVGVDDVSKELVLGIIGQSDYILASLSLCSASSVSLTASSRFIELVLGIIGQYDCFFSLH